MGAVKRLESSSGRLESEREPVLLDRGRAGVPAERREPPNIGTKLREARLQARHKLADIARALNLAEANLKAIEEGRFRDLPGPTYAIGFVRSYARHLGLDADAAVAAARDEIRYSPGHSRLAFPTPSAGGGAPRRSLLLASAVLLAVVYGGWYYLTQPRGGLDLIPAVPERLAELAAGPLPSSETPAPVPSGDPGAGEAAALAAIAPAAGPAPASAGEAPLPAATAPSAQLGAANAAAPAAAAATAVEVAALEDGSPPPIPPAADQPAEGVNAYVPHVYGAAYGTTRVTLVASGESWVQVRGPGDELLLTRMLRAGDKYVVPDRSDLTLVTGNAGALSFVVDGQALAPLGESGEVVRGIALDAQRLLAGTARAR